jgi:hypothetical protein
VPYPIEFSEKLSITFVTVPLFRVSTNLSVFPHPSHPDSFDAVTAVFSSTFFFVFIGAAACVGLCFAAGASAQLLAASIQRNAGFAIS